MIEKKLIIKLLKPKYVSIFAVIELAEPHNNAQIFAGCIFIIIFYVMAKRTPIEQQEVDCQLKALLKLILKKTGISYNDMIRSAEQDFITANLEYVSDEEKKQFDKLIFANNDKEAASFAFVR